MPVAIFTDNDFDKVNGVTTTLKAVLQFGREAAPRIYTAADVDIDTPEYFAAGSLGVGLPWYREMRIYWPRLRRFARQLAADQIDVVHITTPGPVGLAGRALARRLGLPIVGSYHTNLGDYTARFSGSPKMGASLEAFMRWCYAPCDPLLVPSEATRTLLTQRGYRADRLDVWGRGVDVDRFRPERRSQALRNHWHVDERRPCVLYAGRISREKDLHLVEPLQRALRQRHVSCQFVFAGDGPMRVELQSLCPDAIFLGTLSHDEMAVAMASADVFFFPSTTDTLGNVVLEAQAAGLPVVVSDRGGPSQHLQPDRSGIICRAGDVEVFADALMALTTSAETRAGMKAAARAYALTRDWPSSLQPLFGAWTRAAGKRTTAQTSNLELRTSKLSERHRTT
jgi:glycosyltransferase involved in cell wall biosynthesis